MKWVILAYVYGSGKGPQIYGTTTGQPFRSEKAAEHRAKTLWMYYPQLDVTVLAVYPSTVEEVETP